MKRFAALAFAGLVAVGMSACSKDEAAVPSGPAETITKAAADLRASNIVALVQTVVPPKHYERMKSEWKNKIATSPSTEAEKAEFAATMAKLTAADAETALYAEIEPALAKYEAEMAAQLPLMVGMGRGFAGQAVAESTQLNDQQKAQANQMLDAVAAWVQKTNFFDRELAKKSIARAVKAARDLNVKTLDEVEKLEFEQMLEKVGIAFQGFKDVLAIYGLDFDATLDSVKASVVSEQADQAKVKVEYTFLGQALSAESDMVKSEDRWYGKEALAEIEKAANAPAVAEPAPAAEEAPAADEAAVDPAAAEGEEAAEEEVEEQAGQ